MQSKVGLRKHHYEQSGGDRTPTELFQILKDDAIKVLYSIYYQIWKTQKWTGKGQFSFQSQRKVNRKKVKTIPKLHTSHMLAK